MRTPTITRVAIAAFLCATFGVVSPAAGQDPQFTYPDVAKVDQDGKPLKGMVFGGAVCNRFENDKEFQCADLSEYSWSKMLNVSGTPMIGADIPVRGTGLMKCLLEDGSVDPTFSLKITLFEITPPSGYTKAPGKITLCPMPSGWVVIENTSGGAITYDGKANLPGVDNDGDGQIDAGTDSPLGVVTFHNNRIKKAVAPPAEEPATKPKSAKPATLPNTGA